MTSDGPKIVIEGMRGDWPGGTRTLTSCDARLEPNGQSFWFGVDLNPDGNQVWFRITPEMPSTCGRARSTQRSSDSIARGSSSRNGARAKASAVPSTTG